MSANKITLRKGSSVGESCAEDDTHFLENCFIEKHQLNHLIDITNNSSILLGRTGAGKTALLNHLHGSREVTVARLDPQSLFFQYVSNSKTFDFFAAMGANLDVIFSVLWKHILIIESTKLYFDSQSAFERATSIFKGEEKSLKKYLDKWDSNFWNNSEIAMQEIVTQLETNLTASAGISLDQIKLGAEGASKLGVDEKIVIQQNILSAVNTPLISLLHKAIDDLNRLTERKKTTFYILLDELDENWIVSDYKYRLIRALIESIRKFRKVRKFKIIVAMRDDLYERTISETSDAGFQAEKHKGLIVKLDWDKNELFQLLEKRIEELFKWKYTKSSVKFADLFPTHIRKTDTFKFLIDRTLMRPRDLIEFVNDIFEKAAGVALLNKGNSQFIAAKRISEAEESYSFGRKQALIDEWITVHPAIEVYLMAINSLKEKFGFDENIIEERIDEIALLTEENLDINNRDSVSIAALRYLETGTDLDKNRLKQELFAVLYKVGIIAVKLTPQSGYKNSFDSVVNITPLSIGINTKFSIRPAFWKAFGITPNI